MAKCAGQSYGSKQCCELCLVGLGILDLLIRQMKRSEKLASFVLDVI